MASDHHPFRSSPTFGDYLISVIVVCILVAAAVLLAVGIFALLSYC